MKYCFIISHSVFGSNSHFLLVFVNSNSLLIVYVALCFTSSQPSVLEKWFQRCNWSISHSSCNLRAVNKGPEEDRGFIWLTHLFRTAVTFYFEDSPHTWQTGIQCMSLISHSKSFTTFWTSTEITLFVSSVFVVSTLNSAIDSHKSGHRQIGLTSSSSRAVISSVSPGFSTRTHLTLADLLWTSCKSVLFFLLFDR